MSEYVICKQDELYHHGILGMKWGVRRYQNKDGSLTPAGIKRYHQKEALSDIYKRKSEESKERADKYERDSEEIKQLTKKKKNEVTDLDVFKSAYYTQTYGKNGKLNVKKTVKKLDKAVEANKKDQDLYSKAAQRLKVDAIQSKTPEEIAKTRKRGANFVGGLAAASFAATESSVHGSLRGVANSNVSALLALSGIGALSTSIILGSRAEETAAIKSYLKKKG